jgi:hypothetical protein
VLKALEAQAGRKPIFDLTSQAEIDGFLAAHCRRGAGQSALPQS